MADINKTDSDNIAGSVLVEFCDLLSIAGIPDAVDNTVDESLILLVTAAAWDKFYGSPETVLITISPENSNAGHIWNVSLKLRYPKDSASVTNTFISMARHTYLIKLTDANGIKKLLGSRDNPMRMVFEILNPGEMSGYNGYQVEFKSAYTKPPYYLI